jgi:hypothetical protein
VQLSQVLDVFEGLLIAAEHPDIVSVRRYGQDAAPGGGSPAGIKVKHRSGSEAYLWGAIRPGATPVPMPDKPPAPRFRAPRLAIFAAQLLGAARPPAFRSWQLVAFPGLGHEPDTPLGLDLVGADGGRLLLRATAGSGDSDPLDEPFPDYRIPSM